MLPRLYRAALVVVCLIGGTPAVADVITLTPDRDGTLYEDPSGAVANGVGQNFFAGLTDAGLKRRGVLHFDIAGSVPAGSTIDAVLLALRMNRTKAGAETVGLHRLLASWGEGASNADGQEGAGAPSATNDATWIHRFYPGTLWSAPGGDFAPAASATQSVAGNGLYSWSSATLKSDVQGWLDTPASNHGWLVLGAEPPGGAKTAKRFASREAAESDRPALQVTYTPPGPSGACCDAVGGCSVPGGAPECASTGGAYQGNGSTCTPNPCPQPPGACCFADPNATCTEVSEASCTGAGGRFQGTLTSCTPNPCPVVLPPFVDALPIPRAAQPLSGSAGGTASYRIVMRERRQQLHRDLPPTTIWGYGDDPNDPNSSTYPGPTIEAGRDLPVTVTYANDLRDPNGALRATHYLPVDTCPHGADDASPRTVVHLHGGHVPADVDGYPESTFLPGQEVTYTYPNHQLPATLWFHDHALGITRLNVQMGMAAFYLLRDPNEAALGLPADEFEIPLVIQDRRFAPDGSLKYPATWQEHFFGDTLLVNGKVWPYLDVKQGKYRFRLLNGSNSRTYRLRIEADDPNVTPPGFSLIGTDGGLLPAPVAISGLTLGPGERADVVVDFAPYAASTELFLRNDAPAPFPGDPNEGVIPEVMKFVVQGVAGDTDPLPGSLRPLELLDPNDASVVRDFVLAKGGDACTGTAWLINGMHWDDVTEYPRLGDTEIWRFVNDSGITHPMHMHLVMFQVLDHQPYVFDPNDPNGPYVPSGSPVGPTPTESGWKDTVQVGPGEITRVIARFERYTGRYAYHCHILEHEDHEMMRQFQTVDCGNGVQEPTEECDDGGNADGDGCSADCRSEDELALYGSALGGSVDVTVDGVLVSVPTSAGQTAEQVAAAVAAAIAADPTLAAAGVSALAIGHRVVTTGTIDDVALADPGLSLTPLPVPTLVPLAALALAALLAALTVGRLLRSARAVA